MTALFEGLTHWHWLGLGFVLLAIEVLGSVGFLLWTGIAALEVGLILLLWLLLPGSWANSLYTMPLYIVAAGLHLCRQLRWQPGDTLAHPLLWSLHLAYLFIPLGLLALTAQAAGLPLSLSLASHLLSAGCMGTMILGMIARVS
ncbi:NnrS family protein, partial [Desulfobulbus alkaliphilus]|uniref:NnrS family protein n=1 Tax=Desulfobulbus alkaliphilus TaxID=869814 RepID=UPI001965CFAA